MIRARHTLTGRLVSELYAGPKLNRAFRDVRYIGTYIDRGRSVLMLANHFCWWDGFIQYRLNRKYFHRTLHTMMLEEQLRKNPILNRCGCFSVKKSSKDIIRSLDYCLEVMATPSNMLLIFPQGELQSMHTPQIRFQSGIGYLLKHTSVDYDIVLNVNLVDYHSYKSPRLNVYFEVLDGQESKSLLDLEAAYNRFYTECKTEQFMSI